MRFCSNCGQKLSDSNRFCAGCGATIGMPTGPDPRLVQYYAEQAEAQRKSQLNLLDELIEYFSRKNALFDRYDQLGDILIRYQSNGGPIAMVFWSIILMVFGGICTVMGLGVSFQDGSAIVMMFMGLGIIVGGVFMHIGGKRKRRNYYEARRRYTQELDEITQELYDHYLACPNCPLGPEYVNPSILQALRVTFISGRADSIKECLNVMIEDANQEEMADYVRQIERNTAQTRTCAAIFLAASLFDLTSQ